jgi:hypothetical protein
MKIVLGVFVIILVLVAGVCGYIATRPAEYTVTRSATFAAQPEVVFAQVNDFHKWDAWSPWAKIDPAMKITYSGPQSGKGASYAWIGNGDVGEGQMTIIDSKPTEAVKIDLQFLKPFAASCITDFDIKPSGDKTTVTWTMKGQNNFIAKAFTMFMDMDQMIGADFEKGLAQMKPVVESAPKPMAENLSEVK